MPDLDKSMVQLLREQVVRLHQDEKDYSELQYLLNNLQSRYASALDEKARLEQDSIAKLDAAHRTISTLKVQLEQTRNQLEDQIRLNDQLRGQLRKQKDMFHDHEINQQRHRRQAQRLAQANARLQDDNTDIQVEMRRMKEERRGLFQRLQSLNRQFEECTQTRRQRESQIATLQREKRLMTKQAKELRQDLESANQRLKQHDQSLKEAEKDASNALSKQLALENAFSKVSGKAQELQRELLQTRDQLNQQLQSNSRLSRQVDDLGQATARGQSQNQTLQKEHQAQKRELVRDLTDKYEEQIRKLMSEVERISMNSDELIVLEQQITTSMQRKHSIKQAGGKVSREIKRSVDYLNSLLNEIDG